MARQLRGLWYFGDKPQIRLCPRCRAANLDEAGWCIRCQDSTGDVSTWFRSLTAPPRPPTQESGDRPDDE